MKLDSSLAWKQASAAVSANRDVLLAMAGVFFLLPRVAFMLLVPEPATRPGMQVDEMMPLLQAYYLRAAPFLIPMIVLEAAGTLAMLTLFTDRNRPTVGQAIAQGFACMVPYILAQLLFGMGIGVAGGLLLALATASGSGGLVALIGAVLVAGVAYGTVRLVLLAPVVAVERQRNPVAALARAWRLAQGNVGRIALFLLLLTLVLMVAMGVVAGIFGTLGTMLLGATNGPIVVDVLTAALEAVFAIYMAGVLTAIHRQLAGPSPDAISALFE